MDRLLIVALVNTVCQSLPGEFYGFKFQVTTTNGVELAVGGDDHFGALLTGCGASRGEYRNKRIALGGLFAAVNSLEPASYLPFFVLHITALHRHSVWR